MLARFGATLQPEVPAAMDETIGTLTELLAARRALIKDRTAAINLGKVLALVLLKRQPARHLARIDSQINAIDAEWAAVFEAVHEAFDECHAAERTAMYQMTAMPAGRPMRALPEQERRHWPGPWGEKVDARLHLDAWRILDREEPSYAT